MPAVTSALVAIAAVALGWITIEIACKHCLDSGRAAIDRALDPNYDPDDAPAGPSSPSHPLTPAPHSRPPEIGAKGSEKQMSQNAATAADNDDHEVAAYILAVFLPFFLIYSVTLI